MKYKLMGMEMIQGKLGDEYFIHNCDNSTIFSMIL